jgi:subtilisin family serine protease
MLRLFAVVFAFIIYPSSAGAQERIIPNDPYFKYQISFYNPGGRITINKHSWEPSEITYDVQKGFDFDMTRAWAITTGTKSTIVAILDDGFCYSHEDVRENIWRNPGETGLDANGYRKETNGIDDDHNGYVDDVMGWDFAFNDPDPDCYAFCGMDPTCIGPMWHSIDAMGIIGARGNNGVGVAGINWDVSMMLLKIGAAGTKRGEVDTQRNERAARAIRYATDNGARVINWSGVTLDHKPERLKILKEAIDYAESKGVLLVVATRMEMSDLDRQENYQYPICFDNANIVGVTEIGFDGEFISYTIDDTKFGSNYGLNHVHIGALGQNYTTGIKDNWGTYHLGAGGSDAAPVVSGVAALILSVRPDLKAKELKEILIKSVTELPALKGKVKSGGMVNAYKAVKMALEYPRVAPVATAAR